MLNTPDPSNLERPLQISPIFWAALVVGLTLTIFGVACLALALIIPTTAQLILCSGLGIILGAFGSTATIDYKGVVIAGVAGVTVVLLLLVDHLIRDDFVMAELRGDIKGAQIEVRGERSPYLGAIIDDRYEFVVTRGSIKKDRIEVQIYYPPKEDGSGEEELNFECVDPREIEAFLGSGKTIQWRFDRGNATLVKAGGAMIDRIPEVGEPGGCSGEVIGLPDVPTISVIGSALAQEARETAKLLEDLRSSSSSVRRDARSQLAAQGAYAVPGLLDQLAADPDSYRTRLGVSMALTEMLRREKGQREEISVLLDENDLGLLADAAADEDRTIRVYASEFLYDLADPRVVDLALERIHTASDNGKYNLILVIKGAFQNLPPEDQQRVARELGALDVGPKTRELLDSFAT